MDPQPSDSPELSSYFRELAEMSKPVISSSTFPSEFRRACGPWVSVTAAAAKASFALAGVTGAGPVVDLVLALSGVGNAQTELLKSIKADTRLLREEALRTAVTQMAEAKRVGPSDERWSQFLHDAVSNLYRANSLAASLEEQAVVQFGLACAYLTLNKTVDAQHWIEESVKSERAVLDALLKKRLGIIDLREKDKSVRLSAVDNLLFELGPMLGILAVGAKGQVKLQVLQKRIETFRRFLQFANAVEICAAAICNRSGTEILELDRSLGEYKLSRKSVTLPLLGR